MTLEVFRSRHFVGWLAVSLPVFLLLVGVVYTTTQAVEFSHLTTVAVAVGVGSLFSELTAPLLERFIDAARDNEAESVEEVMG